MSDHEVLRCVRSQLERIASCTDDVTPGRAGAIRAWASDMVHDIDAARVHDAQWAVDEMGHITTHLLSGPGANTEAR